MGNTPSPMAILRPMPGSSLLDRAASHSSLSENQNLVDQMVSSSLSEATKGSTLLAMFGAGYVSRLTRAGVMSVAFGEGSKFLPILTRGGSYAVALANESATFAGIERGFHSVPSGTEFHPSQASFEKDWARAFINLGSLKLLGTAAEGQNPLLQHLLTDLGMVGGQQVGAEFGLVEKPKGNFAEQMVEAEALNWSQKGGMALLHGLSPHLLSMEKSLDLYLRSRETNLFSKGRPALPFFSQLAPEGPGISSVNSVDFGEAKEAGWLAMSNQDGGEGGGSDTESGFKSLDLRRVRSVGDESIYEFERNLYALMNGGNGIRAGEMAMKRRFVRARVDSPKVFYVGIGSPLNSKNMVLEQAQIGLDIAMPLLETDFATLVGADRDDFSFEGFQHGVLVNLERLFDPKTGNPPTDSLRFRELGQGHYEAVFDYDGKPRRVVVYSGRDLMKEPFIPEEIRDGYHVLNMHGAGFYATAESAPELVRLLVPGKGMVFGGREGILEEEGATQNPLDPTGAGRNIWHYLKSSGDFSMNLVGEYELVGGKDRVWAAVRSRQIEVGGPGKGPTPLVEVIEPEERPSPIRLRITRVSTPSPAQQLEGLKRRLEAPIEKGNQWMRISALPQEALKFHTTWDSSETGYLRSEISGRTVGIPVAVWNKMAAWFSPSLELERTGYFLGRHEGNRLMIDDFIPLGSLAMDLPSSSPDTEASQTNTPTFELFGIKGDVARGLGVDLEAQGLLSFSHTSKGDPSAISIRVHSHPIASRYPNGPSQTDQSIARNEIELVYGLLSKKGFLYDGTSVVEVADGQPVKALDAAFWFVEDTLHAAKRTGASRSDPLVSQAELETFRTFLRTLTPSECEEVARHFEEPLKSENPAVRQAAVELAAILIPYVPYETEINKFLRSLIGDTELGDGNPNLKAAAERAFSGEIGKNHIALHSIYPMIRIIKGSGRSAFEGNLKRWEKEDFPFLTPYNFRTLALQLDEVLTDENPDVRYCALEALIAIVPHLHPIDRPLRIRRIFEGLLDDRSETVKLAQEGLERLGVRRIAESMGPVVAALLLDESTTKKFHEVLERMRRREIGQFTEMDDTLIGERVMAIAGSFPFGATLSIRDVEPTTRLVLVDGGKELGMRWIPVHQVASIRVVFKELEGRPSHQKN